MPAPPGEAGRNAMVVNTEVDYRDEDDLTQTDIGHGAGGSSNGSKARTKEQRERLDLLTQRNQLQIKLERVEKTNQVLSRQNTYLSSLLPRHHQQRLPLESDHDDPSSSNSTASPNLPPAPTIAQLQTEIVDLKRENNALRYTFLGETPSVNAVQTEDLEVLGAGRKGVKQEEEPIPTLVAPPKVEQGLKIAGQPATSLATPNPNSDSTIDLRAVLQRVKDLYAENMELAGLLVGEPSSGLGREDDRDGGPWAEVVRESQTMITSLDADLETHSQEIVSLRSRVKELETELESERARKKRMMSMSRSRSRSRPRSVSRGRSMSRSRSRSMSRSRSRSRGRSRSRSRSPSASRSPSRRSRSDSRVSPSRSRSRHRYGSSSPRNSAYRRDSRSDRRRNSSPGRSPSPRRRTPEGSQRSRREMDSRPAAVPPPRSNAGGSNWRTAHGISGDDDLFRDSIKQTGTSAKSGPAPVAGGFSILGASARSAPRALSPPSPRREDRDPPSSPRSPGYGRTGNRRGDSRNQGSRGGGRGRGGRSRSPRRDEVRAGRDQSRQRQSQGRWREEDRYRPESGRRPSIDERLDAPLPDGRNGRRRGGRQSRPRR